MTLSGATAQRAGRTIDRYEITSIFQDEPVLADGERTSLAPDAVIKGLNNGAFDIRAQNLRGGDGRAYTIKATVYDSAGYTCEATVVVPV